MAEELKYNPETVKTVLNVLQKEFEAEEGRHKFITTKVQMMLTLAGILLTTIIFLFRTAIEENCYWKLNSGLLTLSILIIIYAICLFIYVIKVKTFRRIKSDALVFNAELEKAATEVESRLISTYHEAIEANRPIVDYMAKVFQRGTILIVISIILIVCTIILVILTMNT
ncbi:MAG: hypothetical protein M1497_01665 [Nitrospirae bacterium]|nr:hypothetical protein [Nitrospirota bacterium]